MSRISFFIKTTLLFFSLSFGFTAYAQIPTGDLVQITQTPEFPRSEQNVTIRIESFSTDIQKAVITWYLDNKPVEKGTGMSTFTVKTRELGSKTTVKAVVQTVEGASTEKTIVLTPTEIDLVWEADGYVPPFYKGRSLYTYQGDLKIVAIPHFVTSQGTRIDPRTLVYTWKQDGTTLGSQSGYGKNSLSIKGGVLVKPTFISVEVSGISTTLKGQAGIELEATEPQIIFYENSPLYGTLYNKAVENRYDLKDSEATFLAVPFFFSNSSKNSGGLSYIWSINNIERSDLANTESITLRQSGDQEGTSIITVTINNSREILQSVRNAFSVYFTKRASE